MKKQLKSALRSNRLLRDAGFVVQNLLSLAYPRQIRVPRSTQRNKYFLSAFVRVKNEGRFLPEWVAYNIGLGVEHFYVYNNGSSDGTELLLEPMIDSGVVTLIDWPSSPIYPSADLHFFEHFGRDSTWVAVFDPDEFLVEAGDRQLVQLLRSSARTPAIGFNWRYYGSSGHDQLPQGLIVENFQACDPHLDHHVKVILQPSKLRRLRNPHNNYYELGKLARTPNGSAVHASFAATENLPAHDFWLNHYVYRSREDYTRKATQGFADKKKFGEVPRHISRIETEFPRHNGVEGHISSEAIAKTHQILRDFGYSEPFLSPGR